MTSEEIKRIIEALLFASDKPLGAEDFKDVLQDTDVNDIRIAIMELKTEYETQNHSFRLMQIAGGFQMATDPSYAPWLRKFLKVRQQERLSSPALETLSIIAYRQPITRVEIEAIRGVNVEGVLDTLLERGLIRIAGRKDAIGRPILYATTREFLQQFGLNTLAELPNLKEFTEKDLEGEIDYESKIEEIAPDGGHTGSQDTGSSQ